jgi:hypothetical protein
VHGHLRQSVSFNWMAAPTLALMACNFVQELGQVLSRRTKRIFPVLRGRIVVQFRP